MKRFFLVHALAIASLLLLAGCAQKAAKPQGKQTAGQAAMEASPQACGTEASIMLYDMTHGEWVVRNEKRAERDFLPASTFKIPHTLIALQSGVVEKDEVFKWDGKDRGYEPWNRDLSLEDAFRWSAIWVYQEIARRIGPDRMQNYVDLIGYGNTNIGGNPDSFWLDGDLRISSRQQIEFLLHLYMNDLPFSSENMEFVKRIMARDSGPGWIMRAKSGWAQRITPQHGWMVGWIDKDDGAVFFATNVRIDKREDAALRMAYTKAVLQELGIITEPQ